MQFSGLNSNKQRREFWEELCRERSGQELSEALAAIDPTGSQVLRWHYGEGHSFAMIKEMLQRSISTVRNHHNRGIFELQQYFLKKEQGR